MVVLEFVEIGAKETEGQSSLLSHFNDLWKNTLFGQCLSVLTDSPRRGGIHADSAALSRPFPFRKRRSYSREIRVKMAP
jgi:hypothetical protein